MERYCCPRCGERTVGFWQKQIAGSTPRITCSACGAQLAVPLWRSSLVAALAIFVPTLGAPLIYGAWSKYVRATEAEIWVTYAVLLVGLLLGGLLAVWARHRFVPLMCTDAQPAAGADQLQASHE